MAEVFRGTPCIVTVTISDQEGKQVSLHVAGRELKTIEDAVSKALEGVPDEDQNPAPKKARKPRRTKSEMAAATGDASDPKPARDKAWPAD